MIYIKSKYKYKRCLFEAKRDVILQIYTATSLC